MNTLCKIMIFFIIGSFGFCLSHCANIKESLQDYEKENMISSLEDLNNENVAIVGRFVVNPPLVKDDVTIKKYGNMQYDMEPYRNKITMGIYDKLPPKDFTYTPEEHYRYTPNNYIIKQLGKVYYFKSPKKSFYLVGGYAYKTSADYNNEYYYFPARYKIKIYPTDKAIYIGTLYYKRDEFGSMKIKLKDEFTKINKQFIRKFGNNIKLKKRLMKTVD